MISKIIAVCLFSISIALPVQVFGDTLNGRILDEKGEPAAGVLVALVIPPYSHTFTDERGEFSLEVSEPLASWDLIIVHGGYPALRVSLPLTQEKFIARLSPSDPSGKDKITGSPISIEAEKFYYEEDKDTYRAEGEVIIAFQEDRMWADTVELKRKEDKFAAEGRVRVRSAEGDLMEGRRLKMKLSDKTGYLEQGEIFIQRTHFYLRGPRLEKRGEATYYADRVELTTCDGDNPDWRVTGENLSVTIDGYGTMKHGCFYVKKVPLLYAPYLFFPVKTTRQTGFLLPHRLAYSKDRLGLDMGIPFFWAISQDKDATFYQRFMSERGFQEGIEFRYAASRSQGTIYAEVLQDRKKVYETEGLPRNWQEEKTRWAIYMNQETIFREDLILRADIARVSDSFYFKDFTSYNYFLANFKPEKAAAFQKVDFYGNESLSYLDSTVRLEKSWHRYDLSVLVKNTQDLTVATDRYTLQKYPEIAFTGIKQPLGKTPLWFDFSGVYDYYFRREGEKGHLADLTPTFYLPLSLWRHVRFTPLVGLRSLIWSRDDNLKAEESRTGHREIYLAGAMLATELSRTFRLGEKEDRSIKHTIMPEIFYLYSPTPSGGQAPNFVPAVSAVSTANNLYTQIYLHQAPTGFSSPLSGDFNLVSYSLSNFLTLRQVKNAKVEQMDFLRFKVTQYYDIREERREGGKPWSDIFAELDVYPMKYVSLSARSRYDVYDTGWREENYSFSLHDKRGDTASLTYRYTRDNLKEMNIALKAVLEKSLDLRLNFRRDLKNDKDVEKGVGIDYRRQCWSLGFDFGETMNDRVFTIRYSLLGL